LKTNRESAKKYDGEKPRMELLSYSALRQTAEALTFGARKYDDDNWRNGFEWRRLVGAAMRHLHAWNDGEDRDPESGLSHLAHCACCVMMLLEHEEKKYGTDNRYKRT
jgi:hypothetical protein